MASHRVIPSIEQLLQRAAMREACDRFGRDAVVRAAREAAEALRAAIARGDADAPASEPAAAARLEAMTLAAAARADAPSLRRVINATGVVIHTNLGRAPLATAALDRTRLATGYSNLEYDVHAGDRGSRHAHAERLLCALTGAEAAVVVNNNAAAALLTLAALAAGREVIVSRGELVEIGGGFRVPDVLAQSGATLREVGTTNKTRLSDYSAAVSDRTALILRVHPSNFRVEGFTGRPSLEELTGLASSLNVPLVEDAGSGLLAPLGVAALSEEPVAGASLQAGADLVLFSGDKLLGGPQAGIAIGRRALVDRLRTHPLMRALRADKLTYAALEATLSLWMSESLRTQIPVVRMLTLTTEDLDRRARALARAIASDGRVQCDVIDGASTTGGGSAPGSSLPTRLVRVSPKSTTPEALERALRASDPPVIARLQQGAVVIDLRTVDPDDDRSICAAVAGGL